MQILGALPSLDSFQSLLRYDPRLNTQFKSFPSLFIAIEFKLESSGLKQLLRATSVLIPQATIHHHQPRRQRR